MKAHPPQRVRLVSTDDPHTRLRPGEFGTVVSVDATGTVHVRWDSGSTLGMVPGVDRWESVRPGGWTPPRRRTAPIWIEPPCSMLIARQVVADLGWDPGTLEMNDPATEMYDVEVDEQWLGQLDRHGVMSRTAVVGCIGYVVTGEAP